MVTLATPAADLAAATRPVRLGARPPRRSRRRSAPTTKTDSKPRRRPLTRAGSAGRSVAARRTSAAARRETAGRTPRARQRRRVSAGGRPYGDAHVLPHLLPPPHRPLVDAAEPPIARARSRSGRACGRRATSASLGCFMMNDARATSAGSSPCCVASCSSAAASPRWMKIHCTSVSGSLSSARTNAQFRRASKRTAGTARRRRAHAVRRRPAHRPAVGREVEHRVAGPHRPAVPVDAVEEDVDVAPALVRLVLGRITARPARQVADRPRSRPDRSRSTARDARTTAPDQLFGRVVRVPRAPGPRHRVAVTVERQLRRDAGASRPRACRSTRCRTRTPAGRRTRRPHVTTTDNQRDAQATG